MLFKCTVTGNHNLFKQLRIGFQNYLYMRFNRYFLGLHTNKRNHQSFAELQYVYIVDNKQYKINKRAPEIKYSSREDTLYISTVNDNLLI